MEIIKNSKKIIVAILVIIMIIATSPIILGANDTIVPVITPLQRAGEILSGQSLKFKITDNTEVSYVFYEWDRRLNNKPEGEYKTDELEEGHSEYEYSVTAPTTLGLHELSIAAQDYYGNITYWMNIPYVVVDKLSGIVDNEKPKLIFNIPNEYPYNNSTIPQEMPITFRATDNQSEIYYIGYKWTRQIVQNDTGANLVFDEVANIKAPSESGMWYLLTYTRDRANNVSSAYATRVYVKETNYIELNNKINNLPELVEEDYTSESWKQLQDIIAETNKMIADNKSTQKEVDEQITKIDNAINNISSNKKEVNKDELTNYIKTLVSTDYDNWANFESLVEIANNQTLQSEFNKKLEEVKAFPLNAKKIDTTNLDKIEADLEKLNEEDYTTESWKAIQDKIADAKKQTLQSKFNQIVNEIDLSILVKMPKIVNINNNAQYKSVGEKITIEFETNMELYLWNPFTSGYTTAELNGNNAAENIDIVAGQQNKYTIIHTVTAEDVEKGSISYVIKPVSTNNVEGKEVTGEISIKDYIEKIEITAEPRKQYKIDEAIDLTVGKITVTMASGKSEDINISSEKVTIEGFDTSSATEEGKTITVKVKYEGKETSFEITVDKKDVIAKEITVTPSTVIYDGTQKAVDINKSEGMGEITSIKYEKDGTSSTEAPTDAGEYTIRISINEGEKYKARPNFAVGTLVIQKATPKYEVPTNLTAEYGQMLSQVKGLTEGFTFEQAPIAPVGDVGENTEFTLKYTPNDTNNYNVVTKIPVTVKVEKAQPTYEEPTGLTAIYGQTLADVTLPTGFTFEVEEGKELNEVKVGNVGSNKFTVTYTPDNTDNYNVVNNIEVEIEVGKAEAPDIIFPTASRITYGQTLGDSVLTGGSIEYGTFEWVNPLAIPEVNNTKAYKVRFTPNENTIANYKEITNTIGTVQVEVGKANAPKIEFPTASKLNYGSPLAFSKLIGGSTEYGTFAWKEPNTVPTVNNVGYEVVFIPNESTIANYEGIENTTAIVQIEVAKAEAPQIIFPTASKIIYGQTLGDSVLTGGSTVFGFGKFEWTNPQTIPTVVNNGYEVTFVPNEDIMANYEEITNTTAIVQIEVEKANVPEITFPIATKVTYGQTLGASTLEGGSIEFGTFAWSDESIKPTVNNTGYEVVFTPNAETIANYKEITETTKTISVEVEKANAPEIIFPTASKITYKFPLIFSTLKGGSTEYGTFAWKEPNTVPTVNNTGYEVIFTPNEETKLNYEGITTITKTIEIEVEKANAPEITFPTASKITYGQTLGDSVLIGGSTELGTFKWTNPQAIPTVTNSGYEVTFVPSEETIANYKEITNTTAIVQIEVEKANVPEITFPIASKVTYGQTLRDSVLTGGSIEFGTFAWKEPNTVPTVNNTGYEVVFTPNAETIANYKEITEITKTISVEVEKANAPEITFPTASKITYELPLAFSKLTGGSTEYGTFAWKEPNTVPTVNNAGYEVVFTPNEETKVNYEGITTITKIIEIEVEKADAPKITFPTASKIIYGQTLEVSTLEGGSTELGTFAWTNPETIPTVTNNGYQVTFTPNEDTLANYKEITNTTAILQIEVGKAEAPVIIFPTATKVTYGQTLGASTLEGGSIEFGTFAWVNKKAIPQVNNTEGYKVIFTPNENTIANYEEIKDTVKRVVVIVEKAEPTYKLPTGLTAVYGQTLADVTLPEGFTFEVEEGKELNEVKVGNVGTNKFTVTYTPDNTDNYNVVNNIEIEIEVTKAEAPEITFPTASKITYGDTLEASTLTGGSIELGTFAWSDKGIKPTVNNTGYEVVFTPNAETIANYKEITNTTAIVQIQVEKANAPIIEFPTASKLDYTSPLAFSELTGGSTEYGTFAWKDRNTVPTVNNTGYEVVFTPNAETIANYKEITNTTAIVQIEVERAKAPDITFPTASKIIYGQTLEASILQGGSILYGTFAWSDKTIKPEMDNNIGYEVIFTPNDDILANYEEITDTTRNIVVEVGKAEAPEITFPTASKVTYGQTLGDSVLEGGSIELGTFAWLNPSATPEVNNTKGYNVVFTPSEEAQKHYEGIETKTEKVLVEVEPATPTYAGTTEFTAIYGQTLANVTLPTELTFKLEEGQELTDIRVGNVGDNKFTAIYTPTDTNYKAIEVEVTVKVSQAEPTYTGTTEFTAVYGQTLADVALPTELAFKLEEGQELKDISVGSVGNNKFTAIYTPTDTNYKTIEVSLTIKVGQATYDMSGVSFEGIKVKYDGNPHTIQITGTLPQGLTVSYENNTITNVGTVEAIAKFEFNDLSYAINYIKPDNMKATIEIEPVEPTYTGTTEFTAKYGQTLADVTLPDVTSEDGTVIGKLAFKLEQGQELTNISVGDVGDNTFTAIYTPIDTNYKAVEVEVTIQVTPKSISGANVTTIAQNAYEGQTIKAPEIKSVVLDNHTLIKNVDYKISKITYALYDATTQVTGEYTEEKPIKAGVYKVKTTLQGIGNYTGTRNKYDIVEIIEVEISDIDIKQPSTLKTEYKYGESFDLTGWEVTIIYNNGNENTTTLEKAIKEGIITQITYEPETIGEQNVNIIYNENSKFNYIVNVKDYITEIRVNTLPTNIVYKVGETLDTTNMEIVAVKASEKEVKLNNDSLKIELFKDNVKVEGNTLSEEGRYSVRLSYTDGYKDNFTYGDTFNTEFTIVVTEENTTDKRVIILNGLPKVEIEVGTLEYEDAGVSIYNVDNSPLVGEVKLTTKITKEEQEVDKIDTTDLGAIYKITYIVEDAKSVTREVIIVDTTAPEITLSKDIKTTDDVRVDKNENETVITFTKGKASFNLSNIVEAKDNYDKIVDIKYLVTYNAKPLNDIEEIGEQAGEYIVTYTAEDKSGNLAEALVVKFIVLDYPPIIYYLDENGIKIEIKEGQVYNDYLTIMCDKENVTIYYKKDDEEEKEYQKGDILRDGTYTIRGVEGQYISSAERTFIIDTIEPEVKEINVVDRTITFADPSDVYKATLTSGDGSHIIVIKDVENNIDRIDENGIYHITDEDNRISRVYVLRVEDANGNQIRLPKFKLPELKTN